jgi:sulfotransferase 6B1
MTMLSSDMAVIATAAYTSIADKAPIKPPKLYVNGFPKSGLHLAERMAVGMLAPLNADNNWFGTNAWKTERHNLAQAAIVLGALRPGQFIKGHSGYLRALEALLVGLGIGMALIYRDLRDVVVSQAYHVTSDNPDLNHPGTEYFQSLPDREAVMLAIIEGTDEWPGIIERWKTYAGWHDSPHVLGLRFEDMIHKPEREAGRMFDYLYQLSMRDSGVSGFLQTAAIRKAAINGMLTEMGHKEMSTTYRKGRSGEWKYEFTPRLVMAFKAADRDNWLMRLGYVDREDW